LSIKNSTLRPWDARTSSGTITRVSNTQAAYGLQGYFVQPARFLGNFEIINILIWPSEQFEFETPGL